MEKEEPSFIYISESHVKDLLCYSELIPVVEGALSEYSKHDGGVEQPVRSTVPVTDQNGILGSMPGYIKSQGCLATKLVTFYPNNVGETHKAVILLFNHRNGDLKALVEGEQITAMRTAAASAVATKYLAPVRSRVLAIVGSGVQARSHAQALSSCIKFEQIRVWGRSVEKASRCVEEIGGSAVLCATVQDAVRDADVICTVTSSEVPVLMADWVKPGAHINAVGACRPQWNELQPELVRACDVYVDSRDGANQESGDIIKAKASITAELGEVVLGRHVPNREATTMFKSLGMAVEDGVSAQLVFHKFCARRDTRLHI